MFLSMFPCGSLSSTGISFSNLKSQCFHTDCKITLATWKFKSKTVFSYSSPVNSMPEKDWIKSKQIVKMEKLESNVSGWKFEMIIPFHAAILFGWNVSC